MNVAAKLALQRKRKRRNRLGVKIICEGCGTSLVLYPKDIQVNSVSSAPFAYRCTKCKTINEIYSHDIPDEFMNSMVCKLNS